MRVKRCPYRTSTLFERLPVPTLRRVCIYALPKEKFQQATLNRSTQGKKCGARKYERTYGRDQNECGRTQRPPSNRQGFQIEERKGEDCGRQRPSSPSW
ncbi:hypothetical protein CC80DRAFT_13182 [Byssothecium circinans]|uniref:Uncharacterized protein n=1 Tax=Byssothecium circinans TaxID=147558 RepID=A0A6A5UJ39_9PLEO|nr:hypothetical protein CC80DRAFT_13182 [Byssothecium circinans]